MRSAAKYTALIFLLCLLGSVSSLGQSSSDSTRIKKNTLAITPLKLLLIYNIGPEITYQRKLNDRNSIQAKAAWIYGSNPTWKANGARFGLEWKRFKDIDFNGSYSAIEMDASLVDREGDWTTNAYGGQYDGYAKYGEINHPYTRRVSFIGLSYILGYQMVEKFMFLDLFTGFGLRVYHYDYVGLPDKFYDFTQVIEIDKPRPFPIPSFPNLEEFAPRGYSLGFTIPFNIRLGFAF